MPDALRAQDSGTASPLPEAQDGLEDRLARAAAKVEALEAFSFDTGRLRRMLTAAHAGMHRGMPHQASAMTEDLETRLRLAEDELRETAQTYFKTSWALNPASQLSPDALRRTLLEETMALLRSTLSSEAFRQLCEAAAAATAREVASREATTLADRMMTALAEVREAQHAEAVAAGRVAEESRRAAERCEERLVQVEAAGQGRHRSALDAENLALQVASLEAQLGTLRDRLLIAPNPLAAEVLALRSRVDALSVPPAPAFDAREIRERLQALEGRVSGLGKPAAPLPGDPEPVLRDRLQVLEGRIAGIGKSVAPPPVDLEPILLRLAAMEGDLAKLRGQPLQSGAPEPAALDAAAVAQALKGEIQTAARSEAAQVAAGFRREMDDRLSGAPTMETVEAAVRSAGATLDRQLTERLGALLASAPPAFAPPAGPDPAAFLGQVKDLVQEAMADAFPIEELGRIVDQKVAKRTAAMRAEMSEVEAALVKATMKHLEGQPLGEAQIVHLVEKQMERMLLKYIQP